MVVITDDEDRENEGDLIIAASKINPAAVNFMAVHGRGLICVPITEERAEQLSLASMVAENRETFRTNYTVSVDAAKGVTTGISAADRAKTIKVLSKKSSHPRDLVQPGHLFPLVARRGGVLRRAGHTEASVDLARLAGLDPSAVICEILNEDGTMARLPELLRFREKHGLKMASIQSLIEYRRTKEKLIEHTHQQKIETDFGPFEMHVYCSVIDDMHHIALVKGKIPRNKEVLVRVHQTSILRDIFLSRSGAKASELHQAMELISQEKSGVILCMRPEHPLLGLPKAKEPQVRRSKPDASDTQAKASSMDLREYGIGAQILYDMGVRQMQLLTNHPRRVVGLEGYGLKVLGQRALKKKVVKKSVKRAVRKAAVKKKVSKR